MAKSDKANPICSFQLTARTVNLNPAGTFLTIIQNFIYLCYKGNSHRVVCVEKFSEAVYVLYCFEKKTQTTSKRDMDLARKRYMQVINMGAEK